MLLTGVFRRLFDKHHRDLVADRIDKRTVRVDAFEPRLGLVDLDLGFALRTAEDL